MKPIGQRFVDVEGIKIDEDTVLVNHTYRPNLPLEAMSPVAIDAGFTRHYLSKGDPAEIATKVTAGFNRAAWEQDFVVIEGSGHAGVGSVFKLSNAQVASLLNCKVILVSRGGVGGPIDEISLNLALFEKYGVEVIGVILNKVQKRKIESLYPFAEAGLKNLGLPLLGVIPYARELKMPTVGQICRELDGSWLAGQQSNRKLVNRIRIGTASSKTVEQLFDKECLLVTSGDREDLILSVLGADLERFEKPIAGMVLTDGLKPPQALLQLIQRKNIPFISVNMDSYEVVSKIHDMTVKTEPGDQTKIDIIQNLYEDAIDIDKIIDAAKPPLQTTELNFD